MGQLYDQLAKKAITQGEKLEMVALKSLSSGTNEDLFKEFGFDDKKVTFAAERFLDKEITKKPSQDAPQSRLDKPSLVTENPFAEDLGNLSAEGAADFFNQLGSQPQPQKKEEEQKPEKNIDASPSGHDVIPIHDPSHVVQSTVSRNADWNEGHEKLIKENLLIGNLQYAAEIALKCGRTTTALLIAESGGPDLFNDIKQRFFEHEKDPFVQQVVQAINMRDLTGLTEPETLKGGNQNGIPSTNWKESLAYLYAYFEGSTKERNEIIAEMGENLLEQKDISAAIVCFILSQNVSEVLNIWKRRAIHHIQRKEATREVALADLLQKFILLKLALEAQNSTSGIETNEDFNQILCEVGNYLTSDETAAISYIKYLNLSPQVTQDVAALRDRMYHAHETAMYGRTPATQLPFQVERIRTMNDGQQRQQNVRGRPQQQQQQQQHSAQNYGGQQRPAPVQQRPAPVQQRPGPPSHQAHSKVQPVQRHQPQQQTQPVAPPTPVQNQPPVNNIEVANYGYNTSNKPIPQQVPRPYKTAPVAKPTQPRPVRPTTGGFGGPRPSGPRPMAQPRLPTPNMPQPALPQHQVTPPSVQANQAFGNPPSTMPPGPMRVPDSNPSVFNPGQPAQMQAAPAQANSGMPTHTAPVPMGQPRPVRPMSQPRAVRPRFAPIRPNVARGPPPQQAEGAGHAPQQHVGPASRPPPMTTAPPPKSTAPPPKAGGGRQY